MLISKYGYDVVGAVTVLVAAGAALSWYIVDGKAVRFGLLGLLFAILIFTLYFFRDPDRTPPQGDNLVLAPADGEIVLIKDVQEDEFLKSSAIQVSIFMSPLNVHVNRFPISGTVRLYKHIPGEYLVAFEEKSSLRNERTHIGLQNARVKVFFKQIAGFVARRIVANIKEGDTAVAGERFGMIKFGSRVDVIVPKNLELKVKLGDRTVAGETVLAVASHV